MIKASIAVIFDNGVLIVSIFKKLLEVDIFFESLSDPISLMLLFGVLIVQGKDIFFSFQERVIQLY